MHKLKQTPKDNMKQENELETAHQATAKSWVAKEVELGGPQRRDHETLGSEHNANTSQQKAPEEVAIAEQLSANIVGNIITEQT